MNQKDKLYDLPGAEVLKKRGFALLDSTQSAHKRALLTPINIFSPRWYSNNEIGAMTGKNRNYLPEDNKTIVHGKTSLKSSSRKRANSLILNRK